MGRKSIFLVVVLFLCGCSAAVDNLVCTDAFCRTYREENGCPVIALPCRAKNSTHSGRLFPSPVPCGCCETCIEDLELDSDCTIGSPGAAIPLARCGPGLNCTLEEEEEHPTCQIITATSCMIEQISYDNNRENTGLIGHLMQRILCDEDGDFAPIKCIPGQICYCVDKAGERIFGESLNFRGIENVMKCECSRKEAALERVLGTDMRIPFVRCDEMGSYDRLQCIGDRCLCVDIHSGFPTSGVVNITLHGLQTLPCFNESGYGNETYVRSCEETKTVLVQKLYTMAKMGLYSANETKLPEICQPDGYYARIQQNDTYKFCADKFGEPIQNYAATKNSTEAENMTCNCARVELLLKQKKALEIPICCPNGNYPSLHCRRGLCYCIDENGNQISLEKPHEEIEELECYNDGQFC
ncbi:uncharacterized protein LOC129793287 [Lutzomyia longipalpis]|uniref:uncharacterized protein LOC129793287 n=1 Tax=Lutzomyia longipalpis TaxID=7200 RepID=UPI0024834F92|nr:uncharacterized protein LOC129793287 [Lutzomyia longipalpis]